VVTTLELTGVDSNSDGINDMVATGLGLDPDAAGGDTDGDGISDVEEVGSDIFNPMDSDGDGVIDALEPGRLHETEAVLAFYVTRDTAQALGLGEFTAESLTIASIEGMPLIAHKRPGGAIPLFLETDLPVIDQQYSYPFGVFDFSVVVSNGIGSVTIQFPDTIDIPTNAVVRKLDVNKQWSTYENAVLDRSQRTVTLYLIDNDAFDLNSEIGVIRDPIGIGVPDISASSGGGGGCMLANRSAGSNIDLTILFLFVTSLLRLRRKQLVL
jgi:hypothetical protein